MSTILCNTVSTRTHLGAKGEPKWNVILPFGKAWHPQAPNEEINVTAEFCERMIANWREAGGQGVQVNYFHKGRSNIPAPIDDKIAGAWMEDFRVGADGLEALMRYTPRARGYIANDELRYFSIELDLNGVSLRSGQRVGPCIRGGALLNDPHFTNLPRLAAHQQHQPPAPKEKTRMDRKKLCESVGLPETATDAELRAALASHGMLQAAQASQGDTIEAALAPVKTQLDALKSELAASQAREKELGAMMDGLKAEKREAEIHAALIELEPHYVAAQRETVKKTLTSLGVAEGKALIASWPTVRPPKGEMGHGKAGTTGMPESKGTVDFAAYQAEVDRVVAENKWETQRDRAHRVVRASGKFNSLFNTSSLEG